MYPLRALSAAVCLSVAVASHTAAQVPDLPNTADHPLVSRFAGSALVTYDEQEFDRYSLLTGLYDNARQAHPTLDVEGRVSRRTYVAPEGATLLTVYRNFEQAVRASALETLFSCVAPTCDRGSRTVNEMIRLNPNRLAGHYHNLRSITDFGYLAAKGTFQGKPAWVAVGVGVKAGDGIRYTVNGRPARRTPTDRVVFSIDIVEQEAMATGLVTVDALARGMEADGRVVLDGLFFDTDTTTLKAESAASLGAIADYLKQAGRASFFVTGHTDAVGAYDHNLALSRGRAEAVVKALVEAHDIAASRLTAVGVGPVAPAASNDSEAGRARNRRVELVKR